ncbi:flavoprotein [Treponema sp. R6D11]
MNILLGVSSSVAIYKSLDLISGLKKDGDTIDVIMSGNSEKLVSPALFQALTGKKVYTDEDMFKKLDVVDINHISLSDAADVALVCPATANTIAKLANGFADNMLTSTFLALPKKTKKFIAPAMNTNMYKNPAVQKNLVTLKTNGYEIIDPREGRLACGAVGVGALAKVEDIKSALQNA